MQAETVYLPRSELTQQLLKAMYGFGMTIVVAPMGYGKTTLALAMVRESAGQAWYYSVPAGPHDAKFLWHDMFDSFAGQGLASAAPLRGLGFPETASQARKALALFQADGRPACLVLDDYHHVTDPAMSAFWESLVKADPPGLHVVLFSRSRPNNLNVEELCIKQRATVLEQDKLAFSPVETANYFLLHGIDDPEAAKNAQHYSEGWPAALWLCLQSWRACGMILPSPDIESLLSNTVFSTYNSQEQAFLLCTSVPESFTPEEAQALSGDPAATVLLRTLRNKNAFLLYDEKNGRYHFHSIFRDYLRKELAATPGIDKPALYGIAARCCLLHNDPVQALRFYVRAGRDEDYKQLLDIFLLPEYETYLTYFREEIFAAVTGAPWRVRLQNPLGYVVFLAICAMIWGEPRTVSLLEELEERCRRADAMPEDLKRRVRGECEVLRGILAFNDIDKIAEHYTEACRLLKGPSVILSKGSAWSFGSPSLSFIGLRQQGAYGAMQNLATRLQDLYSMLSGVRDNTPATLIHGEMSLEQGNISSLDALLQDLREATLAGEHAASATAVEFCQARLCLAQGKPEKALLRLADLRARIEALAIFDHLECHDMATGYICACLNRLEDIPQWLRDGEMHDPPHNALPQVLPFALTVHGKAVLLQKDYPLLAKIAESIGNCTGPAKSLFAAIHGKILQAVAAWHTLGPEKAMHYLDEALSLTRADGLVTLAAEYGQHIEPLLRHAKRLRPDDAHLAAILERAKRVARFTSTGAKNKKRKLLTPREQEFLTLVAKGMSNPAIAEHFGVTRETVKKALGMAYAKLGVVNRVEATRRYMELFGYEGSPPL